MIRNISYVSLSFLYVNILGYFFHFYVSRKLAPEGYGEFMVLYSLMLTVGNITSIFSIISVKSIVENFNERYEVLRFLRLLGIFFGFCIFFTGLIFSPFIKIFLKISYLPYIWVVSLCWLLMFSIAVERGFLQAINKFGIFAFSSSFELTIRFISAIFLLSIGFYIWGAIFPSFVGIFACLIFLLFVNKNLTGKIKKLSLKKIFEIALYASPSGFFIYVDDIFIKRIFDPHTAGLYASASIIGKGLIWFSITIFSTFFPKLVSNVKDRNKLIKLIIGLNFMIFVVALLVVIFFGEKIFLLLFGSKFIKGFKILPYYLIAIFPLNLSVNFIGINTASEKNLKLIYLHLLCYITGFIFIPFENIKSYLLYIFILNFSFLILNLISYFKIKAFSKC